MSDAEQLPPDPTITQIINDKINQKFGNLSKEINALKNLLSKSDSAPKQTQVKKKNNKKKKNKKKISNADSTITAPKNGSRAAGRTPRLPLDSCNQREIQPLAS